MISYIVTECSKLAQKEYKNSLDWVGEGNHWKLCKRMNFGHSTKWYMHKPESVQVYETNKVLRDFEIQTDHLIPVRRPVLVTEILLSSVFFRSSGPLRENERKRKESKYWDLAREPKKLWNIRMTVILTLCA